MLGDIPSPTPQNAGALAELRHLAEKYRQIGHLDANWDPLGLWKRRCGATVASAAFIAPVCNPSRFLLREFTVIFIISLGFFISM